MRLQALPVLLLLSPILAFAPASARAAAPTDTIYSCVDTEGHRSYQNTNDGPQCRRLDGMVASIPAPDAPRPRPIRSSVPSSVSVSAASFPRVDPGTQRLREDERRGILEQELRSEQSRLAQLRAQSGAAPDAGRSLAEDIERSEGNIAALQRELSAQRF